MTYRTDSQAKRVCCASSWLHPLKSWSLRETRCHILLADKGYDSDAIRQQIETTGAAPNIPQKSNRRWKPCFSLVLDKGRNAIERMFGRIKDFRSIAARYDLLATNFPAAVCIAATVRY